MKSATEFYAELRETTPLDDYAGLSQSEHSTMIRHENAAKEIYGGGTLLDLGCGTGLVLETLQRFGKLPEFYMGVDMLGEGREAVESRCAAYRVPFVHVVKPEAVPFETLVRRLAWVGAVLCIGVVGHGRYASTEALDRLLTCLRGVSASGYVTVPIWFEGARQEPWLMRQDKGRMEDLARAKGLRMNVHGPHEVGFAWGGS